MGEDFTMKTNAFCNEFCNVRFERQHEAATEAMTEAEQVWSDDDEPEPSALAYSEASKEAGSVLCGRWHRTCQSRGEECQLQHYGIGKKGAPALGASLRVNVCMRALGLSDNGLGSEGVRSLVDALLGGGAPALIILDLSQNQAGPDGAAALGELLAEHTKTECGLQTLRFDANVIGDKGAGQLASGLATNRSLRSLHLCRNEVGCEGAGLMAPALAQNATLETLSLEWNQIRADGCRALISACRDAAVTELDLGWNGVRDEACAAISAALRDGSAPLRELKLHNNHVSAEGGAVLCAALEVLDALELTSQLPCLTPVSPLSLPYISQVLDALDVSGNPLANEGVSALLLAHHALPADRPCRLRMEEVCVRPGSNLPLLLAKLSAGQPIEMQARSREIDRERSIERDRERSRSREIEIERDQERGRGLPHPTRHPAALCARMPTATPPLPLGVLPAAPRRTLSPHLGPRTSRRRARPAPLRVPCPRWPPWTRSPSRPRTSPSTASPRSRRPPSPPPPPPRSRPRRRPRSLCLSTRPARKRARPGPSRTWIQPISRSAETLCRPSRPGDFPPTAQERGAEFAGLWARFVLSCERVCPESRRVCWKSK